MAQIDTAGSCTDSGVSLGSIYNAAAVLDVSIDAAAPIQRCSGVLSASPFLPSNL